jgi:hypothetical protein
MPHRKYHTKWICQFYTFVDSKMEVGQAGAVTLGGNVAKVDDNHGLFHSSYLRESFFTTINR